MSWRTACSEHRMRALEDRALTKHVAEWGPQGAHVVDLHTGKHMQVTFWLRDDVKALCVFDCQDGCVGVYVCSQMEDCEEVENAEATSRRFFLGLSNADLRRGILITMDMQVHSIQILHQGQLRVRRAQILLLLKDRDTRKALLGAMNAMRHELLLQERTPDSVHSAFQQISSRRDENPLDGPSLFLGDDDLGDWEYQDNDGATPTAGYTRGGKVVPMIGSFARATSGQAAAQDQDAPRPFASLRGLERRGTCASSSPFSPASAESLAFSQDSSDLPAVGRRLTTVTEASGGSPVSLTLGARGQRCDEANKALASACPYLAEALANQPSRSASPSLQAAEVAQRAGS